MVHGGSRHWSERGPRTNAGVEQLHGRQRRGRDTIVAYAVVVVRIVRPPGEYGLLTIVGRGTVKNREVLNWNHFAEIPDVNTSAFKKLMDGWILQYVEMFSGS